MKLPLKGMCLRSRELLKFWEMSDDIFVIGEARLLKFRVMIDTGVLVHALYITPERDGFSVLQAHQSCTL